MSRRMDGGPRPLLSELPADISEIRNLRVPSPSSEMVEKLNSIPFFRSTPSRFASLGSSGGGGGKDRWNPHDSSNDGFSTVTSTRTTWKPIPGGKHPSKPVCTLHPIHISGGSTPTIRTPTPAATLTVESAPATLTVEGVPATLTVEGAPAPVTPHVSAIDSIKFGTYGKSKKHEKSFEESQKGLILGKLNKISDGTYDVTKEFLKRFLDPDDTSVLTDFVNSVFDTAACSAVLCKICTKLLHELTGEFPHVRVEMHRLFQDFIFIFDDTIGIPEVNAVHYPKFLEAQKRKRLRRGYSRFIVELLLLKELPEEPYIQLLNALIRSLQTASIDADNKLQCTEYADCLKLLLQAPPRPASELMKVLQEFAAMKIADLPPGLSAQSKFALMDAVSS